MFFPPNRRVFGLALDPHRRAVEVAAHFDGVVTASLRRLRPSELRRPSVHSGVNVMKLFNRHRRSEENTKTIPVTARQIVEMPDCPLMSSTRSSNRII